MLAKMRDWQDRDSRFALAFTELRQMLVVLRTDGNASVINHELEWLGNPLVSDDAQPTSLYGRRRKWAVVFNDVFTFGTVSTQFGESMNKGMLDALCTCSPFSQPANALAMRDHNSHNSHARCTPSFWCRPQDARPA